MSPNTEPTTPTPEIKPAITTPDALDLKDEHFADKKARTDRWGRGKQWGVGGLITAAVLGGGVLATNQLSHHGNDTLANPDPTHEAPVVPGQVAETTPAESPSPSEDPTNPANTITATPTETAPETAQTKGEHSTSAEYSVSKADIQKYLDMSDQEFKSLKVEDRVLVSMYAISMADNNGNGATLADVANDWYNGSKDPTDKLPATISENNTPIDALHIAGYLNRIAYTVTTSDGVTWDEQLANKDLLGATVTGSTNASTLLNDAQKVAQSNNGMAVSAYGYGGESGLKNISSIISSQSITDPEGHKAYKINYYDTVTKAPADITVSWVVASNGQGIWVDYNQ